MSSRGHEKVEIAWFAVPNVNERAGGYLPVYTINRGRVHGHTYGARGYDLDEAEQMALALAQEEAARYVGDWDVEIQKGASQVHGSRQSSAAPRFGSSAYPTAGEIERDVSRISGGRRRGSRQDW